MAAGGRGQSAAGQAGSRATTSARSKAAVLQNILETETEYSKELQTLLSSYLRSLHSSDGLTSADVSYIQGNLEEISTFQQMLVQSLEECSKLPESQQRVGGFFLNLMPQMKALYMAYCSNHPTAVSILTEHSKELGDYMEGKGANSPGILTLTTGLSKAFMRLDKYPTLLKELERHMEDHHLDRPDIQLCMTAFKSLSAQCQGVRKRKELELQILTDSIRRWEGDDITTLGSVLYMSHTVVHSQASQEKNERYFLLFPQVLLMLSTSTRMSGFIYQGRLPITGMLVSKLEDGEILKNAFEISSSQCERMQVVCDSQQDQQEWVEHLQRLTNKHNLAMATPTSKPQSVPCHTLPSQPLTPSRHSESRGTSGAPTYHTLPHPSSHGSLPWPPLEPPSTPKPWSLSCLRPAPPLRPSAALCYKEDLSKSPKSMKKLLPKRKPERKPSEEDFSVRKSTAAALEEDAQILKVIEAYCTSAKTRQTLNSRSRKESGVHMLFPEEEKIIVEETKSNGQTVMEEKTLVDTVYGLKDELQELKQDNKRMRRTLEEEQRARKELEKIVRRVLKSMNDPSWDETNL
ncbi:rho guanine nucleotide exchange factor 7b isoform X2 [Hypomesus transpacificus]|uniref:rho guanine nucleotide exchange factor 7b isoform X2 n=1 Tax=Hypomesus transpacificus TaxID=137520 RepID=UPI001F07DD31|nr:rho guanine nucleotide exchange factor 7b isoform X2 [Hypomesus transpacificus]